MAASTTRRPISSATAAAFSAFGWANVFTLGQSGKVTLSYDTPITRPVAVVVQLLLWLIALRLVWRAASRATRQPVLTTGEIADVDELEAVAPESAATEPEEIIREPRPIKREPARAPLGPDALPAEDLPWLANRDDVDPDDGGEERS